MWLERFVIVVTSLQRDFLPSRWGMYYPTFWDYATFAGTLGLFFTLLFLFIRFLPMISMTEVRELVAEGESEPDPWAGTAARFRPTGQPLTSSMSVRQRPQQSRHGGRAHGTACPGAGGSFDTARRSWATEAARLAGYRRMDAYSPVPVEGLAEALGRRKTAMPLIVLFGGIVGRVERLFHAVVFDDDRLSVQRRRPAVPQLADVHPGDVRADRACARRSRG